MKLKIFVTLKPGVLDPQGKAIEHALSGLGFAGIAEARVGIFLEPARPGAVLRIAGIQLRAAVSLVQIGADHRRIADHEVAIE